MGIFAKGRSFPATVVPDTPQNRYGGLTDESVAGKALGEALTQVGSTASSANTTAGELIDDIERLEARINAVQKVTDISGDGWRAYKWGRIVFLAIQGATGSWNMPRGWTPTTTTITPVVSRKGGVNTLARVTVRMSGTVDVQDTPNPVYGSVTYMSND